MESIEHLKKLKHRVIFRDKAAALKQEMKESVSVINNRFEYNEKIAKVK
jgi:hypothetical protein